MNSLDELIKLRRSIRKYLPKAIEQEKLDAIFDAARLAPSACNAQPWRFVAVTDPLVREKIFKDGMSELLVPNNWARSAPVIIVVASELDMFTHKMAEKLQDVHYHLIDIGIACEHLVLKATELGLGTCYIGWFNAKGISKVLNLPASWKVDCLITLGYPQADDRKPSPRKELKEIAFYNGAKK